MNLKEQRALFEQEKTVHEQARLTFHGVDGFDVYNPSIPFTWNGNIYIFGRVERRSEWARSVVRLFKQCGRDEWRLSPDSMVYQLEDPFIAFIHGEILFGGVHVRCKCGELDTYYCYFYRGTDLHNLRYFTTGPNYMKDIRLVELADGRIGVFSRPRNADIMRRYGCETQVGFTIIDNLDQLTDEVIEKAPYVPGFFGPGEWGGCNQAYLLESGMIGMIGHKCYDTADGDRPKIQTYLNMAFVFDPSKAELLESRIIGTRSCYPAGAAKRSWLIDCAFTSGMTMRADGKIDLYSGLGDAEAGRIAVPYPFAGHGRPLSPAGLSVPLSIPSLVYA